jgi:hypothetical protein
MKHYKPFVFLPIVCSGPLSFASACSLALARTTSCSRPWAGRKALDSTPQRPALARPALLQLRFIRQQAFPASTSLDFRFDMPVTLASLPAELHARIAAMCAVQDRRFKDAKSAINARRFPLTGPNHLST